MNGLCPLCVCFTLRLDVQQSVRGAKRSDACGSDAERSVPAGQQAVAVAASPPGQPAPQLPAAALIVTIPQPVTAAAPAGAVQASRVRIAPSAAAEERRLAAVLSEAEAFTAEFRCDDLGA